MRPNHLLASELTPPGSYAEWLDTIKSNPGLGKLTPTEKRDLAAHMVTLSKRANETWDKSQSLQEFFERRAYSKVISAFGALLSLLPETFQLHINKDSLANLHYSLAALDYPSSIEVLDVVTACLSTQQPESKN